HGGLSLAGVFLRDNVAGTGIGPDVGYKVANITDGTSNTFMVGEMSWEDYTTGTRYRSWVRGCQTGGTAVCAGAKNVTNRINTHSIALFNDMAFGSMHLGGCHFLLADGSARFVSENINMALYLSLASRDGSEPVSDF